MSSKPRKPSASSSAAASSKPKKSGADPLATAASGADSSKTHKLSLKGSGRLVGEFFDYALNTILFQRGVYPPEDFSPVKKYGLNMLVSADDQVRAYIKKIMGGVGGWMRDGKISRLVVVITGKESGENVERWQFDVDVLRRKKQRRRAGGDENAALQVGAGDKGAQQEDGGGDDAEEEQPSEAEIQQQIQGLFRQITASVTFLPMLAEPCTFNVLVYADADSEVPVEWGDSDAKEIEGGEKVVLRSFSTGNHRVGTVVSYRMGE